MLPMRVVVSRLELAPCITGAREEASLKFIYRLFNFYPAQNSKQRRKSANTKK